MIRGHSNHDNLVNNSPIKYSFTKTTPVVHSLNGFTSDYHHNNSLKVHLKSQFKRDHKPETHLYINPRKGIKTAAKTHKNTFNSTFGPFTHKNSYINSNQQQTEVGLDIQDPFEITKSYQESGIDADTPTLPFLENQVEHREDQPMPQHLPIFECQNDQIDNDVYSYDQTPPNVKLKSQKHIQNKIFLISDQNFSKIIETVSNISIYFMMFYYRNVMRIPHLYKT